jgi:hypothetical protein
MSFDDLAQASLEATLLAAAQPLPEKQALAYLILDAVELANNEMAARAKNPERRGPPISRGKALLHAQRDYGLPRMRRTPRKSLNAEQRQAFRDILRATHTVFLRIDEPSVTLLAMELAQWRAGERAELPVRQMYRNLGRFFVPMPERRRLLFPDRPPRPRS